MGNLEESEKNFLKALEYDRYAGDALLGIGWISWSGEKYDEAISYFRRALMMRGSHADAYIGLAWSYIKIQKFDMAYSMLHRALFFSPSYRDAREALEYLRTLKPEPDEKLLSLVDEIPVVTLRYGYSLILPMLLILAGIIIHSRLSFLFALSGLCSALVLISFRGSFPEFESLTFIYNIIAISIACGGLFFVLNRSCVMLWVLSLLLCSFLWLVIARSLEPIGIPPLGFPFVLTLAILLFPFSAGILEDGTAGLHLAGFDTVATTPENVIQWKKRQSISLMYWEKIRSLEKKLHNQQSLPGEALPANTSS